MFKFVLAVTIALACAVLATERTLKEEEHMFNEWKAKFAPHQVFNASVNEHKFTCFRKILKLIDYRNAQNDGARHGVNKFSALCPEEFEEQYLHGYVPMNHSSTKTRMFADAPASPQIAVDWRHLGAVTPVKDQGACGSCWAFSTAGNIESMWKIAGNHLVSLSDQEIASCSKNGNNGCLGGLMTLAFQWVIQNGGVNSEAAYPYVSGNGSLAACNAEKSRVSVAHIQDYNLIATTEAAIATYLERYGPVSVGLCANQWNTYTGGIMKNCAAGQPNHAVVAVAVDTTGAEPVWVLKNSWGTSWGEEGYIRLQYGTNQCYVRFDPSSSVV